MIQFVHILMDQGQVIAFKTLPYICPLDLTSKDYTTSQNSITNWRPHIQISEPVENISYSNHNNHTSSSFFSLPQLCSFVESSADFRKLFLCLMFSLAPSLIVPPASIKVYILKTVLTQPSLHSAHDGTYHIIYTKYPLVK